MSSELDDALGEIAAAAGREVPAVDLDRVRLRVRRRRIGRAAAGATAAVLVLVAAAVATATAGVGWATRPAVPAGTATTAASPTVEPDAALPGWEPGGAPCGQGVGLAVTDDPSAAVEGAVTLGSFDPSTAGFVADPAGSVLWVDVTMTGAVPGAVDGTSVVRLVDESGTVAFWNDPSRVRPRVQATENSHLSSMSNLFDAVDCRTGRPLHGTYRVLATAGSTTVELAPLVDEQPAP